MAMDNTIFTPSPPPGVSDEFIRVLVVDDDDATRVVLRLVLEDAGYIVHEASDGLLAMNVLLTSPYPLVVVLDLMMPRMSGTEILELFANDPVWAQRHAFLLLTAAFDRPPTKRFRAMLQQLATPLVRKPFDLEELLGLVAAAAARLPQIHAGPEPSATLPPSVLLPPGSELPLTSSTRTRVRRQGQGKQK
jgi:CheY-like chemotaxis protein